MTTIFEDGDGPKFLKLPSTKDGDVQLDVTARRAEHDPYETKMEYSDDDSKAR